MKPVATDTVERYDWSTGARSGSQSYGLRRTARRSIATSVRLNPSHFPFACGRYAVVRVLLTPKDAHNSAKKVIQTVCRDLNATALAHHNARSTPSRLRERM